MRKPCRRSSPVHLLVLLLGVASVVRIAGSEVDSSTAAAASNQQYATPKEHLTPPPQRQTIRQYIQSNLLPHRVQEPSFIQRVARFFGFDYGRKVYPPPPPVNTQNPVKFPSSTESLVNQQYNTYTPPPPSGYNINYNPNNNYGPYPGSNNNQGPPSNGPGYPQNNQNNNQLNPNNFNNYQGNPNQQQFNSFGNQPQQQQQFNGQQQNLNQPPNGQFNGQQIVPHNTYGPPPNAQQFQNNLNNQPQRNPHQINLNQQQQQPQGPQSQFNGQQQQNAPQNNAPSGNNAPGQQNSFPYAYQTYGPPVSNNQQPVPPSDSYSFQPSQQFQPSFGPPGFQPLQQQQQRPDPPPPPPQIITPPPTPPSNAYLPARSPSSARQMAESFDYLPCNQSPWIPMYNGREIVNRPEKFLESTFLGASHKAPTNNYYPTPPPRQPAQVVKLNPNLNTWAHQVSSDLIVGSPKLSYFSTPSPINKVVTSPEYLPPSGRLPVQQQQHPLVPIPIPNLSVTAIPPLYDYRPFSSGGGGSSGGNNGQSAAQSQQIQGGGGGGVTNIIIGTNVGHPNAPQRNVYVSSSTAAPFITNGGAAGYQYPPPQNQLDVVSIPSNTNSHAGYQYPKPSIIPDLSPRNNGKQDPKSQVESVETTGNEYRNQDVYNDFEIIKSIPVVQFSTAVEVEPKNSNAPGYGGGGGSNNPKNNPGAPPQKQTSDKFQQQNMNHQMGNTEEGLTAQPIIVGNQKREEKLTDSYTAASSHNFTIREEGSGELPINYVTEPPNYLFEDEKDTTVYGITPPDEERPTGKVPIKKDRDTPKNLLDSPVFYLRGGGAPKPFTRDPSDPRLPPSIPEDRLPSHNTPATMPDWIRSSPFREASSTYTTTSTTPKYKEGADGGSSGMAPPPPPMAVDSINLITNKPKQIQIIIPYTTNMKPHPFRTTLDDSEMKGEVRVEKENYEKWANFNHELHNEEESKIVTATEAAGPKKTTKFLTRILASSIRDLLNNERDNSKRPIDIYTLQKNIDDWTEQEFSAEPHKASTISLAAKSKTIPDEYLTTTPSMRDLLTTTTQDDWYEEETTTSPPYFEEQLQNDQHVADNKIIQVHDNFIGSDRDMTEDEIMASEGDYWNKFKLAISPLTQEKVYVVTPQPPWDKQLVFNNADGIEVEEQHKSSYKNPRFSVRPMPGKQMGGTSYILGLTLSQSVNNLQPGESTPKPITPELFGKLGHDKTPFDIADHEEIHSFTKRITIVTASPIGRKFERVEDRKS